MMKNKITIYVGEELTYKLSQYKNKSNIVQEALNQFFTNKKYFLNQKNMMEEELKEIELKKNLLELKIKFYENQLKIIEQKTINRPPQYKQSIQYLKKMQKPNMIDVAQVAKLIGAEPRNYYNWLMEDKYFYEIFPNLEE